jgi:TRAP-type C4-dicarboxylate transport system permease small subunit
MWRRPALGGAIPRHRMTRMRAFQAAVFRVSRFSAQLAAVGLVYMVAHILYEIVLRSFFDTSTYVLDEFVGYGVAAITFLALGFALEEGSLIRVNLLLTVTRGWVRRVLETFVVGITLAMSCYVTWYFWFSVKRNFIRGTTSESIAEVPLWIPEGLVLLGLVLFCVQLFAYLLRVLTGGRYIGEEEPSE